MGRTSLLVENPAKFTLKWKNEKFEKNPKTKQLEKVRDTGWYYWDKELNDGKGGEVLVPMPVTFMWLESASSFTGYNEATNSSIYSNEVLDLKNDTMTVRMGKDIIAEGTYAEVKDKVAAKGGKFCIPVYALMDGEVVRFLMTGASLSWINFNNRIKNNTHAIVCYDTKQEKKGSNEYEVPVFKYLPAEEEDKKLADEAYETQVKPYFEYMLSKVDVKEQQPVTDVDFEEAYD